MNEETRLKFEEWSEQYDLCLDCHFFVEGQPYDDPVTASAWAAWQKLTVEIGELQGTIKLLRKDKQMFYEVEKGRAEQAAIDKDFIQQYQREIEQLQASRKRDCVDFFRWFWNQPGTNAEQGYDKWLSLQTVGSE